VFVALLGSLEFMVGLIFQWMTAVRARLRERGALMLEFIVLRHQVAALQRTGTCRPCFRPSERRFWVVLSRWWTDWQCSLMIVQPETVFRWRRRGLSLILGFGSRGRWRGGRPKIDKGIRDLIVRMNRENFLWGAPRIHGEGRPERAIVSRKDCPLFGSTWDSQLSFCPTAAVRGLEVRPRGHPNGVYKVRNKVD